MKEKIKNRGREITLIIVVTIVLLLFFSGFSMGKELSKINLQTKAEIAEPILKVESDKQVEINSINQKGIYQFKVKNYDETDKTTGINLEYYIEILSPINKNLNFKIFKENKELEINENKTGKFEMTKDKKQEDNFKIEVECNKNVSVEEIIQQIQVKVHSEQKKL